jgi:fluoride exporter
VSLLKSVVAVAVGAAIGALARWQLGNWLNPVFAPIPLGTLAANLVGGFLAGVALAVFASHPGIAPEWRLLIVTGFLGGLTTFSAFSAEVTILLEQQRLGWAAAAIGAHVAGSVTMTLTGVALVGYLRR